MAKKSFGIWTFVIGGIVGGAVAYLGRGELERTIAGFKNVGSAQRARTIVVNRARMRRAGYAV